MKIGLIDVDGKLPNLALMKVSTYYEAQGEQIEFVRPGVEYDDIYASAIYTSSKSKCEALQKTYGSRIQIGGTGWDIRKQLPPEIENCKADYNLYTAEMIAPKIRGIMRRQTRLRKAEEIVNAGIGFTSRGCIRKCPFCVVPIKEGCLVQDQEIKDIINPRSNIIVLCDNNLTADPYCIDKLQEIRDRKLIVDINQGCDIRLMTDEIAAALASVRHLRSLHYAWDLMCYEKMVLDGIRILTRYFRPYRQMCFMLVGFDTSFEEDMYRFRMLSKLGVSPYVMVYNDIPDPKLKHFERWVNGKYCKSCSFEDYAPYHRMMLGSSAAR